MNILAFTSLWPNGEQPDFGVFIKHRVAAMARLSDVNVRVVAPVPYFPKSLASLSVLSALPKRWQRMARLPAVEEMAGLTTFHPRCLVTPKVGMRFYGDWMARGAWATVRRLHAERPIDLIDAHYVYPDGAAAIELGRRLNVPVVVSARGSDINQFSHLPHIRPRLINTLNRAAGVVAVSEALKQQMIELGIVGAKIAVIPNGIDRQVFHLRDRNAARRKLGLDPQDRIMLTVGALIPRKGIDRLIDAVALLAKKDSAASPNLFIIGEGPERANLKSNIEHRTSQNNIFLIGAKPQAELADWYAAADLFCLASHREGCPNVVVEALACGLPVVAAEMDGIREFVGEGCGSIVSEPSGERLSAEIGEALEGDWNRRKIAAVGAERGWDQVARDVADYFAERGLAPKLY